jgi:GNAT superfamily N-acetyltransferase
MTLRLVRMSGLPPGEARARFTWRFSECGARLRTGEWARHAPSPAYTEAVLELARARPHELLMVLSGEWVVGRAAVVSSCGAPSAAALGLFEVDLAAPADAATRLLLDAADEWARANGFLQIFAPVDVNTWFSYRFSLTPRGRGAAVAPYEWEPAQPPEYLRLFRSCGFAEAERYATVGLSDALGGVALSGAVRYTARAFRDAVAAGFRFERLAGAERVVNLLGELHGLCMDAFRDSPLFEPLPVDLFRRLYASAAAVRQCGLTHVVRDIDGRLVGVVFAFADGDAVIIKTIAVARAARGRGLSTALTHLVLASGAEADYRTFVTALVRRGNRSELLIRPHLVPGVRRWQHEYVLLRREAGSP